MAKSIGNSQKKRLTLALMPGLIAFSMGQTVLFAVAGPAFREVGLSESQLGLIISAAAAIFVVSSAVWGRIADRWGRRPTVLFGLWTYALVSLAFAAVLHLGINTLVTASAVFTSLLGLRLAYAAFGAGIQPSSVAMMADVSSREERSAAVAVIGAAFGIGMVLGPAAAAGLVGFGMLTPLYAIAGLGFVTAILATGALPKVSPMHSDEHSSERPQGVVFILCATLLLFLALSALQQTMAFHLQDLLLLTGIETARLTGFCFMAIALTTLAMQGGVIQYYKPAPRTLLLTGLPMAVLGFALYGFATAYWQLLLASAVMGIGFGLANPGLSAAASLQAGVAAQGKTAGLMQAMMSSGYVFGPLVSTSLYEIDPGYSVLLAGGSASLALLTLLPFLFGQTNAHRQGEEARDAVAG